MRLSRARPGNPIHCPVCVCMCVLCPGDISGPMCIQIGMIWVGRGRPGNEEREDKHTAKGATCEISTHPHIHTHTHSYNVRDKERRQTSGVGTRFASLTSLKDRNWGSPAWSGRSRRERPQSRPRIRLLTRRIGGRGMSGGSEECVDQRPEINRRFRVEARVSGSERERRVASNCHIHTHAGRE